MSGYHPERTPLAVSCILEIKSDAWYLPLVRIHVQELLVVQGEVWDGGSRYCRDPGFAHFAVVGRSPAGVVVSRAHCRTSRAVCRCSRLVSKCRDISR